VAPTSELSVQLVDQHAKAPKEQKGQFEAGSPNAGQPGVLYKTTWLSTKGGVPLGYQARLSRRAAPHHYTECSNEHTCLAVTQRQHPTQHVDR
jgi:hypothetical protein